MLPQQPATVIVHGTCGLPSIVTSGSTIRLAAISRLGLDRAKRPIDAVASNMGHCLWTGILERDRAEVVARRLLADDMFSGWGIRTMSSLMSAYNPLSYHCGSVWPHDTALIASGLMRYGFVDEALTVVSGLLLAAAVSSHGYPSCSAACPLARRHSR